MRPLIKPRNFLFLLTKYHTYFSSSSSKASLNNFVGPWHYFIKVSKKHCLFFGGLFSWGLLVSLRENPALSIPHTIAHFASLINCRSRWWNIQFIRSSTYIICSNETSTGEFISSLCATECGKPCKRRIEPRAGLSIHFRLSAGSPQLVAALHN